MTPEKFTTRSLPMPDQFDAWCDWLHSVFDVLPRQPLDSGFPAKCELWKMGALAISRVCAPADTALPDEVPLYDAIRWITGSSL